MEVINVGIGVGSGSPIALIRSASGHLLSVKFPIKVNGWEIAPETEPWALKYGNKFKATNEDRVLSYTTLEEAIDDISTR